MPVQRYDTISIVLHWLVVVAILLQYLTGWAWGAFERGSEERFVLFRTHIVVGSTILALAFVRAGWRLTHRRPPLPDRMSRWTARAAGGTHAILYGLIFLQPVLGLLTITAFGKSLGDWPGATHIVLVYVILAVVGLHVAAALWHQFVRRDGLILRMVPGPRPDPDGGLR